MPLTVAAAAPPAPRTRARWPGVLSWVVLAPFALWAVLRLLPWDVHFRWVQLVAFTPYVAAISPIAPLLALASRRRAAFAAGLAVTAILAAQVLPRAVRA